MYSRKNSKNKKRSKLIINLVLLTITLVSLFFTIYPPQMLLLQNQSHNYQKDNSITILKQSQNQLRNSDLPEYAEPTLENLAHVKDMPKNISGKIVIPSVGINLPITQGIEDYKMLYAAGEQYDRSIISAGQVGNYVLASHSTPWANTLFTNLLKVKAGEEIYVSDDNNVYEYEIVDVRKVSPDDVNQIQLTDANGEAFNTPIITLYTCTDQDATGRYVVRGELTHTTPNSEINSELRTAFEDWHTLTLG